MREAGYCYLMTERETAGDGATEVAGRAPERPRHRMVDRVAAIMELVARSGSGLTLTAVAKALDAPISSTQGLLNGLVAVGYLDERNRIYTLGTAPYLLNVIAGRPPVTSVTHNQLAALHAQTGLTTTLATEVERSLRAADGSWTLDHFRALATDVGDDLFYVDFVSADPHYAYLAENKLRRSLLRTSSGWLLLADRERRDVWAYLKSRPRDDAEYVDRFLAALEDLRNTGVCVAPGVAVDGGDGVSVALRERGRTIATVGVIGSRSEVFARKDELASTYLKHATAWGLR